MFSSTLPPPLHWHECSRSRSTSRKIFSMAPTHSLQQHSYLVPCNLVPCNLVPFSTLPWFQRRPSKAQCRFGTTPIPYTLHLFLYRDRHLFCCEFSSTPSCRSANTYSFMCPLLPVESEASIGAVVHSGGAVQDGENMCYRRITRKAYERHLSGGADGQVAPTPVKYLLSESYCFHWNSQVLSRCYPVHGRDQNFRNCQMRLPFLYISCSA